MNSPDPNQSLERELAALQAEHRRLLESGSYRLSRLLVEAGRSPRALFGLPIDLFRLAKEIRGRKRPPGPGSIQYERVRGNWQNLARQIRSTGTREMVVLFSGTTYIQGTKGNRSIRQAQALLARGVPILFSYHRNRFDEELPVHDASGLVQSPVDITMQLLEEVATADLASAGKLLIVSYPYPGIEKFVDVFRHEGWATVYDCRDDWEEFSKVGMARWFDAEVERRLVAETDLTFCVSRPLVEKMCGLVPGRRVELMPNAVEASFLPAGYQHRPEHAPQIVGYFGHLSSAWFDWEAFAKIAQHCQQYRFEIIGHSAPQGLNLPQNVALLGPKPWQELHRYAARWSAAVIPFRIGRLADAVDPIKIYEYLAFGLPVVSFRMPQISDYPYTATVDTVEAFCRALEVACQTTPQSQVISTFLERNTWEVRANEILRAIQYPVP